ncbi:MAG TPA: hypothetical protein VFH27_11290 [Longimicrobiaceae bacterium]|nr:hypothetical protein [Longimicrobiaceae bacterium]
MSKTVGASDDLRPEYDFSPEQMKGAVRGKYAARYAEGVNVVHLDPDVAAEFPDSASVNQALRALLGVIQAHRENEAA